MKPESGLDMDGNPDSMVETLYLILKTQLQSPEVEDMHGKSPVRGKVQL